MAAWCWGLRRRVVAASTVPVRCLTLREPACRKTAKSKLQTTSPLFVLKGASHCHETFVHFGPANATVRRDVRHKGVE